MGGFLNVHVGSDIGGFGEAHGGFQIGQINGRGIRVLDWAVGRRLRLMNSFQKRKSQIITFQSSETERMIDFIVVNSNYISRVKDVKLITDSESKLCSVNGYSVQRDGLEERKIQKENGTVEVEKVRGKRRVCWRG